MSSCNNPNHLYNISIHKTNNKNSKLKLIPGRSAATINSCQTSEKPRDQDAWKYNDIDAYEFLDFYRFTTGSDSDTDLSKYTIKLTPKKGYKPVNSLFMQIGNQSMASKNTNGAYTFKLSKNNGVKKYLNGSTSNNYIGDNGVRTFSIFEYPKGSNNDNYFGKNNIVISTGPDYYDLQNNAKTIRLSSLPKALNSQKVKLDNGKTVSVYIGGIADKLLKQNNRKNINFVVNKKINTENQLPSQYIIVTDEDPANLDNWSLFSLGWDKTINVIGDKNGAALIDGTEQSKHTYSETPFYQFFNGMLDIQSSSTEQYSTSIQGITFLNPPTRNMGTVQANAPFWDFIETSKWWGSNNTSYKSRLKNAVEAFYGGGNSKYVKDSTSTNLFDNQIVGGWLGASDGIESGTPGLYSGRNFFHVSDDSLKLLSKNQNFLENTLHQGAYGSPLSFAYGTGNGPIRNTHVDGLYLHRITQPKGILNTWDNRGGLVMDWFEFRSNTQDPVTGKPGGYRNATFENIYIPQVSDTIKGTKKDANALKSMGYISAVQNPRGIENDSAPGKYEAGGYTFKNFKSYVDIEDPLFAKVQQGNDYLEINPVPKQSQSAIIAKAYFASSIPGETFVDVYGSNLSIN